MSRKIQQEICRKRQAFFITNKDIIKHVFLLFFVLNQSVLNDFGHILVIVPNALTVIGEAFSIKRLVTVGVPVEVMCWDR